MPSDDNKKAYVTGYGKPPQKSQFKKGQSGNKKGRPKGSRNVATLICAELDRTIKVNENGRTKTMTRREAVIKNIVNQALMGNAKLIKILMETLEKVGELKRPASQIVRPPLTMTLPKLRGEDRSYRYGPDGKLMQLYPGVTMVEEEIDE
jgi:hypothetical protein